METIITTEELPSSKLGTREYWDEFYSKELENFQDSKDEGEIWFGHTRMMKVVKWILNNDKIDKNSRVLDIGCGNGVFLAELVDEGYGKLYGLDYSATGIELARNISNERNINIHYQQADFLDASTVTFKDEDTDEKVLFDVCHDKGTYDAISLRPNDSKTARQKYIETLKIILRPRGFFIITSCNWTLDELKVHFLNDFEFVAHIPAPTFQYGGQSGSTVSTAVFMIK